MEKIDDTDMTSEKILERSDLQEYIVNSWDLFSSEISLPGAYLIGKEIQPHESVKDRIDILSLDQNESSLVVIELKRGKDKNQLLQAISYAGMVNTWTVDDIIKRIENNDELKDSLNSDEFKNSPNSNEFKIKIILISESYEPEALMAADWLKITYGVDITAFSVCLHKINDHIYLDIDQKYPLQELSDAYEARNKKILDTGQLKRTWDDIKKKLDYEFGIEGIDRCLKRSNGDSGRSRFVSIASKGDFKNIIINFRYKYINVVTTTINKEDGKKYLEKTFSSKVKITEWKGGLSFNIDNKEDFKKLMEWLEL
jgi:hypothetical protein